MGNSLATTLDRTAMLETKDDGEKTRTLGELARTLDNRQTKTRSQAVLDNKAVMDVLLNLAATTRSADVAGNALEVLLLLVNDDDNAKRLFQEHPSVVPVAMRKLELGAENATENVQVVALGVLHNLAINVDYKRAMVIKNLTLVSLLVAKMESDSEEVQVGALGVLGNLAVNDDNAREMVTKNSTLVSLLMTKVESNSEQVQERALSVLTNLTSDVDSAHGMVVNNSMLVPLLVAKMSGNTALPATKVVYGLSCSPANRAILRGNNSVVAALTKGRKDGDENTSFFSVLALVNLFGAEEDSKVLKTSSAMLQLIFELIARAMNKDEWGLNHPLLAFRYLCVVEHNRQLLWNKYGSRFLTTILAALQRAIEDKDAPAAENAVSTLAQFSSDPKPSAWMRSNKPELDKVIAQLAPFPDALKTAQFLQLTLDPPKVIAAPVQVADSKPTIMISYNWKHQAQARLIHSLLESQGYPVWRDEQNMKADITTSMADAVSKSTVILVLVSPFYKESANCQMECQFAHNSKRKLIPVLVEPGYEFKADGWLGMLLGTKLYYDVSGLRNKAQMEPVILSLLQKEMDGAQVAVATVAPPAAAAPKQPVPQNEAEIREWLSKHDNGEEVADKLAKEGLVNAKSLEMLSNLNPIELKALVELNAMQALTLNAALKELF